MKHEDYNEIHLKHEDYNEIHLKHDSGASIDNFPAFDETKMKLSEINVYMTRKR